MTQSVITCPKCRQQMREGFLPDSTYGRVLVGSWAEGKPKKSFWVGAKVVWKDCVPITAYRCPSCGYLESYAK